LQGTLSTIPSVYKEKVQLDLAKKIWVEEITIVYWEKGKPKSKKASLLKLKGALGVLVYFFL